LFVDKLGGVKLRTTTRIKDETYKNICKLGAGLKKKKKKGKKVRKLIVVVCLFLVYMYIEIIKLGREKIASQSISSFSSVGT